MLIEDDVSREKLLVAVWVEHDDRSSVGSLFWWLHPTFYKHKPQSRPSRFCGKTNAGAASARSDRQTTITIYIPNGAIRRASCLPGEAYKNLAMDHEGTGRALANSWDRGVRAEVPVGPRYHRSQRADQSDACWRSGCAVIRWMMYSAPAGTSHERRDPQAVQPARDLSPS